MTQSPQQPKRTAGVPPALALAIARELEEVADRIVEMKALCDRQMADLADAEAAAAGIAETLARRQVRAEADPQFTRLDAELSLLRKTVGTQVEACQKISRQFLAVARAVEEEIGALRAVADSGTESTGEGLIGRNVIPLRPRAEELQAAAALAGAEELHRALRAMRESTAALFRAQSDSRRMVTALRRRMREHRRRTRDRTP